MSRNNEFIQAVPIHTQPRMTLIRKTLLKLYFLELLVESRTAVQSIIRAQNRDILQAFSTQGAINQPQIAPHNLRQTI